MNRDDVLRVAKECGIGAEPRPDPWAIGDFCSIGGIERFAAAMYAAGAEAMREQAATVGADAENMWGEDFTEKYGERCVEEVIRALPVTPTNTEGEHGADV